LIKIDSDDDMNRTFIKISSKSAYSYFTIMFLFFWSNKYELGE